MRVMLTAAFLYLTHTLSFHFAISHRSMGQRPFSSTVDQFVVQSQENPDQPSTIWPPYQVRTKSVKLCENQTKAVTGYLDFRGRHLFFYYFESQRNPDNDDIIFWFNGGPGCTSAVGILFENGPCTLRNSTHPITNAYSWNKYANVVYVDQPVGSGYSYYTSGGPIRNTDDAATDMRDFIGLFFEAFSTLKGRPFHLMGSSYAGGYLPIFGSRILDINPHLVSSGLKPLNLISIAVGNGISDAIRQVLAWHEIQCTFAAGIPPFQTDSTCIKMERSLPLCEAGLRESCSTNFDLVKCAAAEKFCRLALVQPFMASGRSPFDVRKDCFAMNRTQPCYVEMALFENLINSNDIRTRFGVDSAVGRVKGCSATVLKDFDNSMDSFLRPTHQYVAALLDRGVRILVYAGVFDWRCNWVGNARYTAALEWHGQEQFIAEDMRSWEVDGKVVGMVKGSAGLTFATVRDAGHLVPYEQPAAALHLIRRWLENKPQEI